jgi:hypothetical protein
VTKILNIELFLASWNLGSKGGGEKIGRRELAAWVLFLGRRIAIDG